MSIKINAPCAATLVAFLFVRLTLASDYVFETLDFPGAVETEAQDINNDGIVVGYYVDADDFIRGFTWQAGEYLAPELELEDVIFTGISNSGVIVGSGFNLETFSGLGFTLAGDELLPFEYPGAFITLADGINSSGNIVGVFVDSFDEDTGLRSFRKRGDVFEELTFPGFAETTAIDINDQGLIVGGVSTEDGEDDEHSHSGFILEDEVYSIFSHPDGDTELVATNNVGVLAGSVDGVDGFRSFVFDGENFEDISFPGAQETSVWGMNDSGVLVGSYVLEGSEVYLGFIATPIPEPTGWTMVCLGLSSVLFNRQRRRFLGTPFGRG